MLILGINSAGLELSLTLLGDGQKVSFRHFDERRGQSEVILPLTESCLREVNATLQDIDAIAVVAGPGSFTGLRLGIAAATGLAQAVGCPVGALNRFTLVRNSLAQPENVAIVFQSLRDELYVEFESGKPLMMTAQDIAGEIVRRGGQWALAGDGAALVPLDLPFIRTRDESELVASAANVLLMAHTSLPPAVPFYLRAPDVSNAKTFEHATIHG